MKKNIESLFSSIDLSGMMLSLSGIILGVLLAVADYQVAWEPAVTLVITAALLHIYMLSESRIFFAASLAGAALTAYLSFGRLLSLESLLLLLFSYFVIRLAKGTSDSGRVSEAAVSFLLKGPVALFGAYFVCTHSFGFWFLLFPACSLGLLCVAADGLAYGYGKNMVSFLTVMALLLMTSFSLLRIIHLTHFIYTLTIPVFICILVRMYMKKERNIESYRPAFALSTFVLAVLAGVGFIGYLF